MSDLIERDDVLKAIWDWCVNREYTYTNVTYWLQKRIEAIPSASDKVAEQTEPQTKYPTEWCEHCELWRENNCIGVAQCKQNIKALKELSDLYTADTPQTEREGE